MRRLKRLRYTWKSAAARRLRELGGNAPTVGQALSMVTQHFLQGITCPPTNLEELQKRFRIKSVETEDLPFAGELRRDADGFRIILSKHLSPHRKRFTIAHELGHAMLETTGRRCPHFGSELERICDLLATELLMPKSVFSEHLGPHPSLESVTALSRLFNTSLTATAIRIAELRGCTAFEVQNGEISWSHGIVRKGSVAALDYELEAAVRQALLSGTGEEILYIPSPKWRGDWKLEWMSTSAGQRTLFMLQPTRIPGASKAIAAGA
jgi:hypothetical protein